MKTRIVIFAKAPVAGRVKTRLIPALGAQGAAALAREMLERTVAAANQAAVGLPELCADPDPADPAWMGLIPEAPLRLSGQGSGDLGERMARAAGRVLGEGERILLIGTDCPALEAPRLSAAAVALDHEDVVIHPAEDGGYVLLGLSRFDPSIFDGIGWSGPDVAEQTLRRIGALGWSVRVGETLRDIDEPVDIER